MNIAFRKPSLGAAAASFMAKEKKLLIDGQWVGAQSGQTFAVEDPATQEVIAHVPAGDKADIELAVAGPLRKDRGRRCRRVSARGWSGGLAICLKNMPTNSPSSKRSTTASL